MKLSDTQHQKKPFRVDTIPDGDQTAGTWATNEDGSSVGLVAVKGQGTYVCFYSDTKAYKDAPDLVIAVSKENGAFFQVPCPKTGEVKQVPVSALLKLLD